MENKVLDGVNILDFSWVAVGPMTTCALGKFGATVVRVESRSRVDHIRTSPPFIEGKEWLGDRSAFWACLGNGGKYGITLNLNHSRGIEIAKRLVTWADVVVENFTAGRMLKWGLDFEELKKIKPDIIMLSLSPFGQTGPYSTLPTFGGTIIASSGICQLTGWPDEIPREPATAYSDTVVWRLAVLAIVAALDHRRKTGEGKYIDISQQEGVLQYISPAFLEYSANRRELSRIGNKSTYAAPHGIYRCQGEFRWCAIGVFNDEEWISFCQVIGKPEWITDPEYSTLLSRIKNSEKMDRAIEQWTINHSAEEVMRSMQQAGIAAGIVQDGRDLMSDPQLKSRNYYQTLEHPIFDNFTYSGTSVHLSKTPSEIKRSPCFGEHNEYVYTKLIGMSDEEFVQLFSEGVFE